MPATAPLPNIADALGQFVQRVPAEQQQLLIALSERMAAERYRAWASNVEGEQGDALQACAEREEEVARRIEALHPEARSIQAGILEQNPDLAELARSFFSPYSLAQQFRLQAQAERLGAATWRSFARRQSDAAVRDVLLSCAELEEESAVVLESILEAVDQSCG